MLNSCRSCTLSIVMHLNIAQQCLLLRRELLELLDTMHLPERLRKAEHTYEKVGEGEHALSTPM